MKKKNRQTFLFSLGISLFLFLTAAGIVTVDYQGRRLSFGDDALPFQTVDLPGDRTALEIRLLGWEGSADVTQLRKIWDLFLDFSCIPHG